LSDWTLITTERLSINFLYETALKNLRSSWQAIFAKYRHSRICRKRSESLAIKTISVLSLIPMHLMLVYKRKKIILETLVVYRCLYFNYNVVWKSYAICAERFCAHSG